ncbi:hypothetical protein AK830_g1544 [Neonectria ditissima]|uniref:Uncharacterized protein n=1 Tax=Neonectria ditissima TaxID=78410 RepID=A0A0P7BYZ3_9HYPO|nr:hypothetical protein AK830_g1544 [Neonectria ditissima]
MRVRTSRSVHPMSYLPWQTAKRKVLAWPWFPRAAGKPGSWQLAIGNQPPLDLAGPLLGSFLPAFKAPHLTRPDSPQVYLQIFSLHLHNSSPTLSKPRLVFGHLDFASLATTSPSFSRVSIPGKPPSPKLLDVFVKLSPSSGLVAPFFRHSLIPVRLCAPALGMLEILGSWSTSCSRALGGPSPSLILSSLGTTVLRVLPPLALSHANIMVPC